MTSKLRCVLSAEVEELEKLVVDESELMIGADDLADHKETVARAIAGDQGAIVDLYHSGVLDQVARRAARMISRSANWDPAIAKEDMVHMALVEMLSSCTNLSLVELTRLIYTATRHNVIDIQRRSAKVPFEPLGDTDPCSPELSLQTQIEHTEWARQWHSQLASWCSTLSRIDQRILEGTIKNERPRAIARQLYKDQGDWTCLPKERQAQLAHYVSGRLYKLKRKLALWASTSQLSGPAP